MTRCTQDRRYLEGEDSALVRRSRRREPVIHWHRRARTDQTLFSRRTIYDSVEGYRVVHMRPFGGRRPETFYALRDRFTYLSCHETLNAARRACEQDRRQLLRQQQQDGQSC